MSHPHPSESRTVQVAVAADGDRASLGTAKALFFTAAGLSFLASVYFYFTGDPTRGIYVGLWVPSICAAGALLLAGGRRD